MGGTWNAPERADMGFVGLGAMGFPMAGHLAGAGHRVTVYNRAAARAGAWLTERRGGAAACRPA